MKKTIALLLALCMIIAGSALAFADELPLLIAPAPAGSISLISTEPLVISPRALTRGRAADLLWHDAGGLYVNYYMQFKDVTSDTEYAEAIRWAAAEKIANGYSKTKFCPEKEVSLGQFVTMLYRYAVKQGLDVSIADDTNILSFDDSFDIPSYMVRPFQWALGSGVYTADSAVLGFGRTITEAEAADMILNMNNPVVSPVLGGGAVSLAGGWTNALSAEIPENAQKAFDKATEGLTGAGYTPIAYLGSQVVAGINYKFVCIKQLIYPGATPQLVTVKVYAALDGTATITDVQEIVLP